MKKFKTSLIFLTVFLIHTSLAYARQPSQTKSQKEDYNVLLIIIDTLRPDHLGCYGYKKDTSPAIDKIAKDSVIFENAFSNAGYTLASTMSILTSLYPSSHRMYHIHKDKLSPGVQTMAEIFQAYTYQTAWFSLLKEPHLDIDIGFGRGFQDKVELSLQFEGKEELLNWLEDNQKNKFFLAMNTRSVHDFRWLQRTGAFKDISAQDSKIIPDILEEPIKMIYYELVRAANLGGPPFDDDSRIPFAHPELFNGVYSKEKTDQIKGLLSGEKGKLVDGLELEFHISLLKTDSKYYQAYIAAYDAAIQAVDEKLIKSIYEQLKASGTYDKTMIIITADHGEALGERGLYSHGLLYPAINRVPLIIKMPYARAGKRTKELAQGIDILPTILDLVGIEKPHQAQGKSLVKLMTGKDTLGPNKYVFADSQWNRKSLRSKEWKLELPDNDDVQYGPKELFHLTIDPQEQKNVYALEPQVAAKLEAELREWEAALPSYQDQEYPFSPGIDQAAQERIKKTGYF